MRKLKAHLVNTIKPWERLVVIGDLNANPWDEGITDKESLHALQTRAEAKKGLQYKGEYYPALLNESYQLARSTSTGHAQVWGTFKHKQSKLHSTLRWHILDPVIVSADVAASVSVRTEAPSLPWNEGLGEEAADSPYPDHLPIVVQLELI